MPITKLGQLSSTQITDVQQKHWDVDMKIRDTLSVLSLEQKLMLVSKLEQIINEIKAELAKRDLDTLNGQ